MSNDAFEFKKFIIKQNKCAMKVGTDAVLLGSWVTTDNCQRILDIGTGTGVIALMLAQKTTAAITALEIDEATYEQAKENVSESTFHRQIKVVHQSFQEFWKQNKEKYDLIISNPPFFIDSLKSTDAPRSTARHADVLPFADLIEGAKELLLAQGKFCLILPKKEAEYFKKLAEQKGFYLTKLLRVRPSHDKEEDKRHIMQFELHDNSYSEETLYIRTADPQEYSPEYKLLTKDYYMGF